MVDIEKALEDHNAKLLITSVSGIRGSDLYAAYYDAVDGKASNGMIMPLFLELPSQIIANWNKAADLIKSRLSFFQ